MGFIMDGLDAEAYDRNYDDRLLVQRVARLFSPASRPHGGGVGDDLAQHAANTGLPIYISQSIDRLAEHTRSQTMMTIAGDRRAVRHPGVDIQRDPAGGFGASGGQRGAATCARTLSTRCSSATCRFTTRMLSGKIVSRVTSDTQAFSQVVTLTMDLLSQMLLRAADGLPVQRERGWR